MRRQGLSHRLLASGAVLLAMLVGAATLYAAGAIRSGSAGPGMRTTASGEMSVSNSKDGAAIFDLANVGPGMSAEGEVTVANTGSAAGTLTLASVDPSDAPGLYGGALSGRIEIRIADVSGGGESVVYAGGLSAMPVLDVGTLGPGASRSYRFSVAMRDGGAPPTPYAGDNLYQRAATSLGYEWTLTEAVEGPPDPPPPVTAPPGVVPPDGSPPPPPVLPHSRRLVGDAHANSLIGTSRDDLIYGLGSADLIFGRGGADYLLGGSGADRVYGEAGDDRLRGGIGSDRISGGSGADLVFARDGVADLVDCGSGADTAYVDPADRVVDCEVVHFHYSRLFEAQSSGG